MKCLIEELKGLTFFLSLGGVEESVVGEEFVVSGVGGLVWAI